jgi:hypothetical protein
MMRLAGAIGTISMTLILGGLWGTGCGGTETEPAAANPFASESGFCQQLAEAICVEDVVKACYLSDSANLEDDADVCAELAGAPGICNPQGYAYNADGAAECVEKTRQMYEDAQLTAAELKAQGIACAKVFSAGGAVGASCSFDHQCDGSASLRCVTKLDGTGTCQVPALAAAGADCSAPDAVCGTGLYCNETDNCVAREEESGDCSETQLCIETAVCTNNVCLGKSENAAICANASECLGGFCLKKTGENTGQCGSFIPLTFDGAACVPLTP